MLALYIGKQRVEWADAEKVLAGPDEVPQIELRNAAGRVVRLFVPKPVAADDDPDWVKAITSEEIARRMAGPFLTLAEFRDQTERK